MEFNYISVVVFGLLHVCNGDLSSIVDICCSVGTEWAENNERCDNVYTAVPPIIPTEEVLMCQNVIEVCCLKSKQKEMCFRGKTTAEEDGVCSIRDDTLGAVTFKECCQCCSLGRSIKQMGMECVAPAIGNPCDSQFMECCHGNDEKNTDDGDDKEGSEDTDDANEQADMDECAVFGGDQLCSQICVNTIGSFRCECERGYKLAQDARTCLRNDCRTGFVYNTASGRCEDIDECARRMDTCTASQRCENTMGSYACRRIIPCGTGWTLDQNTQECKDQDECAIGTHNCGQGYECYNIEGSFRCTPRRCPPGARFSSATGQCERMTCPTGLKPGSTSLCVDVNECEVPDTCARHQTCKNTYGSYKCIDKSRCRNGYRANEIGECADIDECTTGEHDCKGGAECINRPGSYVCSCPSGYRRNGLNCEDRNECQFGNVCPSNAECENTPGSYRCNCDVGFELIGSSQCRDINECEDQGLCSQGCVNLQGSYTCQCNQGYRLSPDGRTCIDVDECNLYNGPGVCSGSCENTPGSYRCSCPNGWRLMGNKRSCQDIDECSEGTDRCGANDDVMCFNTRGSHRCPHVRCPSGFSRSALGPRRNSVRCKRLSFKCRKGDKECLNAPLSLSYNFLTFPTNVKIPTDLFSMSGPYASEKDFNWHLNVTSAMPRMQNVRPATRSNFKLIKGRNNAVVALQDRLEGPQDIEIMLTMKITDVYSGYTGSAISKIYLYVTSKNVS